MLPKVSIAATLQPWSTRLLSKLEQVLSLREEIEKMKVFLIQVLGLFLFTPAMLLIRYMKKCEKFFNENPILANLIPSFLVTANTLVIIYVLRPANNEEGQQRRQWGRFLWLIKTLVDLCMMGFGFGVLLDNNKETSTFIFLLSCYGMLFLWVRVLHLQLSFADLISGILFECLIMNHGHFHEIIIGLFCAVFILVRARAHFMEEKHEEERLAY